MQKLPRCHSRLEGDQETLIAETVLYITLCLEACAFYEAKVVEAGYYECECIGEEGVFPVLIDHYHPDPPNDKCVDMEFVIPP